MSSVPQKKLELPPRLSEAVGILVFGMLVGGILMMLGIGFLSPTTTTVPETTTTTDGGPTTTAPDPTMVAKCDVFVESFADYARRTSAGPINADDAEMIHGYCVTDNLNQDFVPQGEIARLDSECAIWDLAQRFADAYSRYVGLEPVELSPCPPSSGGPPPVIK